MARPASDDSGRAFAFLKVNQRAGKPRTRGVTEKPSCETNRAARSMRKGSSAKDSRGVAGVSRIPSRMAARPP